MAASGEGLKIRMTGIPAILILICSVLLFPLPSVASPVILSILPFPVILSVAEGSANGMSSQDTTRQSIAAASVYGSRPLLEAGVRKTPFDSVALKENISLSFADILAYNSSLFVKQYGRATLSTISFRGTSSSHTQVLWNGMKINSPMLGMTDFSLIPAFLTDKAELLHGSSSLQAASGGLGGAILLQTTPKIADGFSMQLVQGIGSFRTVDDFLRLEYGHKGFTASVRAVFSWSPNRFRYVNMDKKEYVYDDDMNVQSSYYPVEYNSNGMFRDWHVLSELGYRTQAGDSFSLSLWYLGSYRQQPRLTVDYSDNDFVNEQNENTLRAVLSYWRTIGNLDISASAGYANTFLGYDYAFDAGGNHWADMTHSVSRTNTFYLKGGALWRFAGNWILRADLSANHYMVYSKEKVSGQGYDAARTEADAFVSLKWKPVEAVGLSLSLREELVGNKFSLPIPAFNADWLVWRDAELYLKGSVSRNCRFPTLNDMYFLPGGNPDLRPESGFSYDIGYSFSKCWHSVSLSAEGAWFDSYIDDWILWLPYGARKNFYTPVNLLKVHAYGVEQKVDFKWCFHKDWTFDFGGNFTWSPSRNLSGTGVVGDRSVGKQLVYVPEYSSSVMASLAYRSWKLLYKWCYYSTRYTMSSNETAISGSVPPYFMNDVTLSKGLCFRWADLSLSLAVRNLFNERYVTVLSRPMSGINFEFFVGITPKFAR